MKLDTIFLLLIMTVEGLCNYDYRECNLTEWRNMTMEQILYESEIVVYGRDDMHMKLRHPGALDSRFHVYCLIKHETYTIPGEIIIESIDELLECYPVQYQTEVGKEYIIGLSLETSGFAKFATVNMKQKTAFPATKRNFEKIARICQLNKWEDPVNGYIGMCPDIQIPEECTSLAPVREEPKQEDDISFWERLFGISSRASTNPYSVKLIGLLVTSLVALRQCLMD